MPVTDDCERQSRDSSGAAFQIRDFGVSDNPWIKWLDRADGLYKGRVPRIPVHRYAVRKYTCSLRHLGDRIRSQADD